jgi:hypothetical protein
MLLELTKASTRITKTLGICCCTYLTQQEKGSGYAKLQITEYLTTKTHPRFCHQ